MDEDFKRVMLLILSLSWETILGLKTALVSSIVGLLKWWLPKSFAKDVSQDIVLVTGGGRGIGQLMALKLAALGAKIVTVDLNEEFNKETIK